MPLQTKNSSTTTVSDSVRCYNFKLGQLYLEGTTTVYVGTRRVAKTTVLLSLSESFFFPPMLPEGYQWRKKEIELSTPLCPNCSVTILQSRRTTTPINQRGIEYTSRAHVIGFVSTPYYPRLIPNVTRESVNVLWHNLFLFS